MSPETLKRLLNRRTETSIDKLYLTRKVMGDHPFPSTYYAIEAMRTLVNEECTLDIENNQSHISYKKYPILAINIVDEAVCAIIYELYYQKAHDWYNDTGTGDFTRKLIDDFYWELVNIANKKSVEQIENLYLHELIIMIVGLSNLATPEYHREEDAPFALSNAYYKLMYTMYANARPSDEYFTKYANWYLELYARTIK